MKSEQIISLIKKWWLLVIVFGCFSWHRPGSQYPNSDLWEGIFSLLQYVSDPEALVPLIVTIFFPILSFFIAVVGSEIVILVLAMSGFLLAMLMSFSGSIRFILISVSFLIRFLISVTVLKRQLKRYRA